VQQEAGAEVADSCLRLSGFGLIYLVQAEAGHCMSLVQLQVDPSSRRHRRLAGLEVDQQAHCQMALALEAHEVRHRPLRFDVPGNLAVPQN